MDGVLLAGVGSVRAVIDHVKDAVRVEVFADVAGRGAGVDIVLLAGVRIDRTVVHAVEHTIAVDVWVAHVADEVAVLVSLARVEVAGAVVGGVHDAVAVEALAGVAGGGAGVDDVLLAGVGGVRAVVSGVEDAVGGWGLASVAGGGGGVDDVRLARGGHRGGVGD